MATANDISSDSRFGRNSTDQSTAVTMILRRPEDVTGTGAHVLGGELRGVGVLNQCEPR